MNGKGVQKFMRDVLPGTILLIEADAAAVGYTLLTDKDDMHVYISKGSGAGGEAGGSDKTGGTWTQPNHDHPHSHTVDSHGHELKNASGSEDYGSVRDNPVFKDTSYNELSTATTKNPGGSGYYLADYSTDNKSPGTDQDSTVGATANTWRTPGRNFTRQQRN